MSFVAVDMGASGTRFAEDNGIINLLPNNMAFIDKESLVSSESPDVVESSLELVITKTDGPENEYLPSPSRVLVGIMAERSTEINEHPDVIKRKYEQRINYVSILASVAVSKLKYGNNEPVDVYLAVPPVQLNKSRIEFNDRLIGKYRVELPKYMGGVAVEFTIRSVTVHPESLMSITSFFFNVNGTLKEENKKYLASTVLSLDIGASTTDLTIVKKGSFMDKSGETFNVGGNNSRIVMLDDIREEYNMELSTSDANKTMEEGRLQLGSTYEVIDGIIEKAKRTVAKKLSIAMQNYFPKIDIPVQTVSAIVVSGGGSMQSQYVNDDGEVVKTSAPMSRFVTDEINTWTRGIEVIHYGDDTRLANIKGLFIKAQTEKLIKAQEEKRKAEAQNEVTVNTANVANAEAVGAPSM